MSAPVDPSTDLVVVGGAALALSKELSDDLESALRTLWDSLESEESRRAYRGDWGRWQSWLSTQQLSVLDARPLDVQRYLSELAAQGKSKPTRARALSVIRAVYGAIVVADVMPANPAREVKNLKVSAAPRTPWVAEDVLRQLLAKPAADDWAAQRDWLICAVLIGTGWRRREVARLRRDQLIASGGGYAAKIRAKGGKEAFVVLPSWLAGYIDQWCLANQITIGPLFTRTPSTERAISPDAVYDALKRRAAATGVPVDQAEQITPHALRRSFVTITGQRGVSLEDRQVALLHSRKSTTEIYDHAARVPKHAPGEVLGDLFDVVGERDPADRP